MNKTPLCAACAAPLLTQTTATQTKERANHQRKASFKLRIGPCQPVKHSGDLEVVEEEDSPQPFSPGLGCRTAPQTRCNSPRLLHSLAKHSLQDSSLQREAVAFEETEETLGLSSSFLTLSKYDFEKNMKSPFSQLVRTQKAALRQQFSRHLFLSSVEPSDSEENQSLDNSLKWTL